MLRTAILTALIGLQACQASDLNTSEVLYTSTHSHVYAAKVTSISITFSVDDYIDSLLAQMPDMTDEQRDSFAASMRSESSIKSIKQEHLENQMQFIHGNLRGIHANIAQTDIKVLTESETTDNGHVISITYDADFVLSMPQSSDINNVDLSEIYLPRDMGFAARKTLYDNHNGCFIPDIVQSIADSPDMLPYLLFYYADTSLDSCAAANSTEWQKAGIAVDTMHLDPKEAKYPEIANIWSDDLFEATMIFTPADQFTDNDIGVYGLARTAQMLQKMLGNPLEGPLPKELRGSFGLAKPTALPSYFMTYKLSGGRKVKLNLVTWNDEWGADDQAQQQFRNFSRTSDFISYNGHAGYGSNVAILEEWSEVKPGHYQIFYVDGCSTFGYLKDTMFEKRTQLNPGFKPTKFLDVVSNIAPSYFAYMPEQNVAFIRGIIGGKSSYLDIFAEIDSRVPQKYAPMIIVHGEEDNTFKP